MMRERRERGKKERERGKGERDIQTNRKSDRQRQIDR